LNWSYYQDFEKNVINALYTSKYVNYVTSRRFFSRRNRPKTVRTVTLATPLTTAAAGGQLNAGCVTRKEELLVQTLVQHLIKLRVRNISF